MLDFRRLNNCLLSACYQNKFDTSQKDVRNGEDEDLGVVASSIHSLEIL